MITLRKKQYKTNLEFMFCLFLLLFLVLFLLLFINKTFAWQNGDPYPCTSSSQVFGQCPDQGYFTGVSDSNYSPNPTNLWPLRLNPGATTGVYNYQDNPLFSHPRNWAFPQVNCSNSQANSSACNYTSIFVNQIYNYLCTGVDNYTSPGYQNWNAGSSNCSFSYQGNPLAAAMIIDTMLGHNTFANSGGVTAGVQYAWNNFSEWDSIITAYASSGRINWDQFSTNLIKPGGIDSTGLAAGCTGLPSTCSSLNNDDEFFAYNSSTPTGVPTFTISFLNSSGQLVYNINRSCGNIVATTLPLVNYNNNPILDSASSQYIPPGGTVNLEAGMYNSGDLYPNNTYISVELQPGSTQTQYHYITPITPTANYPGLQYDSQFVSLTSANFQYLHFPRDGTLAPVYYLFPRSNSPSHVSSYSKILYKTPVGFRVSPNTPLGTKLCFVSSVTPHEAGYINSAPYIPTNSSFSAPICFIVSYTPYLQTTGADVTAGDGFCNLTANNSNAYITSWNNNNGLSNLFNQGAGSSLGVMSTGSITGFASNLINGSSNPLALSFANANNSPSLDKASSGQFGGSFSSLPNCIPNYFSDSSSNTFVNTSGPIPDTTGIYYYNGPLNIINSLNIINGNRVIIYVNGNVNIESNINVTNSSTEAISQISSFKLVAQGNIVINPSVTSIDGSYIAEPLSSSISNSGIIYTCGPIKPTNNCNSTLTVNGSLVANKIYFWRTAGTVGSNPAESINYQTYNWLQNINDGSVSTDKIEQLPPIL